MYRAGGQQQQVGGTLLQRQRPFGITGKEQPGIVRGDVAQHVEILQLVGHLSVGGIDVGEASQGLGSLILEVKIDHRVEAVLVIAAFHHAMAPGFAGHPERSIIQRLLWMGGFPLCQSCGGALFQ
ncbi:hypothetical protein D3C78_964640 [compost metagenome]